MKKQMNLRVIAEIGIFAAIAYVLHFIEGSIWSWTGIWENGGGIGVAMLPIFIIAYRRGFLPGLLCGLVVSLVNMLPTPYIITGADYESGFMQVMAPFFQVNLDYILAYTVCGLAGAFSGMYKNTDKKVLAIVIGSFGAGFLKFLCHFTAGAWFWLNPEMSFWGINGASIWYSAIYNGTCIIPSAILCTVIMVLIHKYYNQFLNPEKIVIEKEILDEEDKIENNAVAEEKASVQSEESVIENTTESKNE